MTPPVVLGIGGFLGHDANAALIHGGRLVAASQEERFSRLKHDGAFPRRAVADCLQQGGLTPADVTHVVFAEKHLQTVLYDRTGLPPGLLGRLGGRLLSRHPPGYYTDPARELFPHARFHYAWHHLSHVAGAFHTSPFDRAAWLCLDGKGEDYCASAGTIDHQTLHWSHEQPYENGLGLFYTLITLYLGFPSFGSEYKVMGLAPYGTPRHIAELSSLFTTDARGGFRLRFPVRFLWPHTRDALPHVAAALQRPPRAKNEPVESFHCDVAASLQKIFGDEVLKMARHIQQHTSAANLLFCGGCAQNCVAAGKLRAARIFENVFNSPVGGDMGSGLGAAFLLQRALGTAPAPGQARGFLLGPGPGPAPDDAAPHRLPVDGDLHDRVAAELARGRVVGWVRGRMELGARALGARSILADPRAPGMQSTLNLKVKFRESFRPFAPAVLADHTAEWFDCAEESDYMNYTANLLPSLRREPPAGTATMRERLMFERCPIPSVIHVDFSARLQTVRPSVHPDFHKLISAFHRLTGVPMIINTSFNVSGQPIVRTAAEAWECFLHTDMDLLVLNDALYTNPRRYTREQNLQWLAPFAASA